MNGAYDEQPWATTQAEPSASTMQPGAASPRATAEYGAPPAARAGSRRPARGAGAALLPAWQWLCERCARVRDVVEEKRESQRSRRLRVLETVALGEKRFVAIIQVQHAQFLIGGGSTGVSLLTRLDAEHAATTSAYAANAELSAALAAEASLLKERW